MAYSTGGVYHNKMGVDNCAFCNPYVRSYDHFSRFGKDRIDLYHLWETENIIVKPDILPVRPDGLHFLMIPKPHRLAFAQLPEHQYEVGNLLYKIEQEIGQPLIFAEHGGGSAENGYTESKNQSVYHQHAHLVAGEGDVLQYMADTLPSEGLSYQWWIAQNANPINQSWQFYTGHPYLYVQSGNRGLWVEDRGDTMKSQVTQRSLSRFFGQQVNWKAISEDEEMARLSVARIASAIERCRLSL